MVAKPAPILCHHCGQDYAHAYWASFATLEHAKPVIRGDLWMCFSCRRDTNPDAADAPRWTPQTQPTPEAERVQQVCDVPKKCGQCGSVWQGKAFAPLAAGLTVLPAVCDTCRDREDAAFEARTSARIVPMGMPLPELQRPQRVPDDD